MAKRYLKSNPRMKPSLSGLTELRRWECVTKYSRLVGLASPTEMPLKKNAGWTFETLENVVCFQVSQIVVGFSRTQSCAWHRPCEILQCRGILRVQGLHLGPFRSSKTCRWRPRKAGNLIVREGFICCESPALVNNTSGLERQILVAVLPLLKYQIRSLQLALGGGAIRTWLRGLRSDPRHM
jgi:hypothetical protein